MRKNKFIPDRGNIIWINFNPQSGREMKNRHPMLVMSPIKFNDHTGIVIGLPMTTAKFNDSNPFAVKFHGPKNITSYVLAHQPKSFDWRIRNAKIHPWKHVPQDVLFTASEILNQIIMLA